jgi:pimeloyl-ACP methyl ester carboxylesterase
VIVGRGGCERGWTQVDGGFDHGVGAFDPPSDRALVGDSHEPCVDERLDISRALAAGLTARGIASLRYDKRGVGESGGDYLSAGFDDETADARAGLAALRSHPSVDADRVIVVGHSAGATLAMRLSRSSPPPNGYVFLAGAAQSGQQVMAWQSRRIAASLPRPLRLLAGAVERHQERDRARLLASTGDTIRLRRTRLNARWFREYMVYDPAHDLATIDRPVLAITGANDIQVDPGDVATIGQTVTGSFDGEAPADISHLLRRDPRPAGLRTYRRQLRQPVDRWVIDRTADWARRHLA